MTWSVRCAKSTPPSVTVSTPSVNGAVEMLELLTVHASPLAPKLLALMGFRRTVAAPMLMALLMGPMMERSLYQALNLSHGSVMVFIQRPISATLLAIIALMSIYVGIRSLRGKKTVVEEAEE